MRTTPRHVTVYANDHSPWVQAVLLGLHERGIAHTLVTVPPLRVFLDAGVLMPAARLDDGPWMHDSAEILAALGYPAVPDETARDLMKLFLSSALRRTDSTRTFWTRFSFARDDHPNTLRRHWNHFWRAFSILYFFTLIKFGGSRIGSGDPEAGFRAMQSLQERIAASGDFLGGDAPDTADLQLFGLVQMFSSIPVPELDRLKTDPGLDGLRSWVGRMQGRCADYDHLYSAGDYPPAHPAPRTATPSERGAFWSGAATMWLAFPVTIPLAVFYVARVRTLTRRRQRAARA